MALARALLLAALLTTAACSSTEPEPAATDSAADGDTTDSGPDDAADDDAGADSDDDGAEAPSSAGGTATVTVDGTTYEATDVLECSTGDADFPDDRGFIGTSADGEVRIDISWFADESLAGLSGVTVEVADAGATGGELAWSTSYAGPDTMTIEQRADGAEGTAEMGSLNRPGGEGTADATWSFTC